MRCVAFSPDGKLLATADQPYNDPDSKRLVRLWDVGAGREIRSFAGHHHQVSDLVFSGDGKRLASCGAAGKSELQVVIWDLGSGLLLRQFQLPSVRGVFSADGRLLAGVGGTICIWDVATRKLVRSITASIKRPAFCFSSDGKMLAAQSAEGAGVYRIATGELLCKVRSSTGIQSNHYLRSWPAVFSPNGKTLVTIDGTRVRLWEVGTGRRVHRFGGHDDTINCLSFAPNGKMVVSGSEDRTVRFWDAATGREVLNFAKHEQPLAAVAFSPDGRRVASADRSGAIFLWRAATGKECHPLRDLKGELHSLFFAADGRRLFACSEGGAVCVWDTTTGKLLRRWEGKGTKHSAPSAVLSPDGQRLMTASPPSIAFRGENARGILQYRSLGTGRILRSIRCPEESYDTLTCTPDGRFLAAMGYFIDHFHGHINPVGVRFWEAATGAEVFRMEDLTLPFAFSPDGRVVASSTPSERKAGDGVRCWDLATGQQLGQATGHLGGVTALAFSGDGRLLASGSTGGTILLWDARPLTSHRLPPYPAVPRRLEELWADLAGADADRAHSALWSLVRRPGEALPFLRTHLHPIPRLDGAHVKRCIADLDSDQFDVRRRAREELARLGELAEPALRATLRNKPSLEVRRSITPLLEKVEQEGYSGEALRVLRAIAVLERIGRAEARQLLERLARGAPEARATQQARAAVQRLNRRISPR